MLALLLLAGVLPYAIDAQFNRPCYYTSWSQYRAGRARFVPEDFEPGLCTHIIYAFAAISSNFNVNASDPNDLPSAWAGDGMYKRVNALKKQQSSLKTLLSIGGGSFSVSIFKSMSASAANRKTFITSAIKFCRQHNFDGIDIDWEYPEAGDKANYVLLIKELREAFEAESKTARLLVTGAVSCGETTIKAGYDIKALSTYFDFVNLMSYDFHGSWSKELGFNAPLYPRTGESGLSATLNLDWAANFWVTQGMPKSKIIIGMTTYARGWTLADKTKVTPGQQGVGPSKPTQYVGEAGLAAYYELCEMIAQGAKRYYDSVQQSSYIVFGDQWYGYDDSTSVAAKANYVKSKGYGGCFTWAPDFDDFNGKCSNGGGKRYPLVVAVIQVLVGPGWTLAPATIPTTRPTSAAATTQRATTALATTVKPTTKPAGGVDCSRGDGFFPNPTSCQKFIRCVSGAVFNFDCGPGTEWDQGCLCCNYPKQNGCGI